ncbi:MAG: hypothetical protein ACRCSU_08415 [Paracoccaceae bacterium]
MTMDANKDRFNARLARISSGQTWEVEGVISSRRQQEALTRRVNAKKPGLGKGELLKVPLAFLIGMLAVISARAWFFYEMNTLFEGLPKQIPAAIEGLGAMGLGAIFAVLALMLFSLSRGVRSYALAAGFALMLYGEGHVMAQAPELFSHIYSAEYLSERIDPAQG